MIIIRMSGGLGNQMFYYALYMKLKSQGKEAKFDDITEYRTDQARPIMLSIFGLEYPRAEWSEIVEYRDISPKFNQRLRRRLVGRKSVEIIQKDCNFDPNVLKHDPAYLIGYFQSEKYFKDIEADVRRAFTFPSRESLQLPGNLDQIIGTYQYMIEHTEAIAIHIRRGDYLLAYETHGGICTEAYYKTAIAYMRARFPEAVFYIFSNDLRWAKEWFKKHYQKPDIDELDDRFCIIEETDEHIGFIDMMLMSKCKHFIIANSSFSWWAAYLNDNPDKVVIAPERWLGNEDCYDIYVDDMIKISSEGILLPMEKKSV